MDLIDAINAIDKTHEDDVLHRLTTVWGDSLDKENVLQEYPRPQFVRDSYINLNGEWEYAFSGSNAHPRKMDGTILVPFSPEAILSGVERQLKPMNTFGIRRCFLQLSVLQRITVCFYILVPWISAPSFS